MKIRGHHLLCLLHFEGKGYNDEFVNNMFRVLYSLENGVEFSLIIGIDDICRCCPHNELEKCGLDDDSIRARDEKVIGILELKEREMYTFKMVKEKIYSKITLEKFFDICDSCQWFYLCLSKNNFKNLP